jgi:hypothetical protein
MDNKPMTSLKQVGAVFAAGVFSLMMAASVAMPASAQEIAPDHLALARKYVDLTDQSSLFEVTLVETGIATMKQILQQNPEITTQVNAAISKVLESYKANKGELFDQFARVYAQRFTPEELKQIVTFYESPTGAKLAKSNPEINKDLRTVLGVYTNNLQNEFFAKVRAELKANGVTL